MTRINSFLQLNFIYSIRNIYRNYCEAKTQKSLDTRFKILTS